MDDDIIHYATFSFRKMKEAWKCLLIFSLIFHLLLNTWLLSLFVCDLDWWFVGICIYDLPTSLFWFFSFSQSTWFGRSETVAKILIVREKFSFGVVENWFSIFMELSFAMSLSNLLRTYLFQLIRHFLLMSWVLWRARDEPIEDNYLLDGK